LSRTNNRRCSEKAAKLSASGVPCDGAHRAARRLRELLPRPAHLPARRATRHLRTRATARTDPQRQASSPRRPRRSTPHVFDSASITAATSAPRPMNTLNS
jgi:hypothetical protein